MEDPVNRKSHAKGLLENDKNREVITWLCGHKAGRVAPTTPPAWAGHPMTCDGGSWCVGACQAMRRERQAAPTETCLSRTATLDPMPADTL